MTPRSAALGYASRSMRPVRPYASRSAMRPCVPPFQGRMASRAVRPVRPGTHRATAEPRRHAAPGRSALSHAGARAILDRRRKEDHEPPDH